MYNRPVLARKLAIALRVGTSSGHVCSQESFVRVPSKSERRLSVHTGGGGEGKLRGVVGMAVSAHGTVRLPGMIL